MAGVNGDADAAPGRLALIQQYANSYDDLRRRDDLADLAAAAAWLTQRGLLAPTDGPLSSQDFDVLRQLRPAIRGLCLANSGRERHAEDVALLNAVARQAGLHPWLERDGQPMLDVEIAAVLRSSGRLVAILFNAMWDGTWPRLKACPGDACNYAFYDHTRNNSRTWCSMARCGSRAKMRAYRTRQRSPVDSRIGHL
jgi:predicted RNA-binding Zn ribbon-like protein